MFGKEFPRPPPDNNKSDMNQDQSPLLVEDQLNMLDCPGVQLKGRPPLLSSCMILCILIFPALPMRMLL